jgi:hypothetical protein
MPNEKPIIAGDASKKLNATAPETVVADKDKVAKMAAEPTAKPDEPVVAKKS